VDLSAMWAGPVAAQLLGRAGARVVKVETATRPDGARRGPARFFDALHGGHESVTVDVATSEGRGRLGALLERADVVIESSRPRALRQLGFDAERMVRARPGLTWLAITAYGRSSAWSNRVGFGDDAAVAGGLVARDDAGDPVFCGDAIADPLSGLEAVRAVGESLQRGGGEVIDVSMAQVATRYAALPQSSSCALPANRPQPPPAVPAASPLGADNAAVRHLIAERYFATC
jgi:crotonobetainyl-CoA:carnitine CoA-transferase CaiB-like acyl-CoA transferase